MRAPGYAISRADGDPEADFSHISTFEGDDIVARSTLRIKVTRRPRGVGDHLEMTADDLALVRER